MSNAALKIVICMVMGTCIGIGIKLAYIGHGLWMEGGMDIKNSNGLLLELVLA